MKEFSIQVSEEADKDLLVIINKYWELKEGTFIYTQKGIAEEHNITTFEVNKLVRRFSTCRVVLGYCEECAVELTQDVTSRTALKESSRYSITRCEDCETEYRRKQNAAQQARAAEELQRKRARYIAAIEEKAWSKLSEDEYNTLLVLLENPSKKEVYKNIFDNNPWNKAAWNVVTKFERLGLISVIRSGTGYAVEGFEVNPKLIVALSGKEEESDAHEQKNPSEVRTLQYLSFSLAKNLRKDIIRQPDYSGTFTLKNDVVLKAGVKYVYGGWEQSDGSISLKFQPADNISRQVEQGDIESEPKHIREIMADLWDDLEWR